MTKFRKKLLLLFFAFFAAITLGAGLFAASGNPRAAGGTEITDAKYFKIEDGVFKGLTDEAISHTGSVNFSITLPATVTAIGDGNEKTGADPSANLLFSNSQSDISRYLTSVKFAAPEKITEIGYRAFVNCSRLSDIDLSGMSSLTKLGGGVFRKCDALTEITLPAGVTSLPEYFFRDCGRLSSVTFEGALTEIGTGAFSNCGKLDITLPESLQKIGASAFDNCDTLTSVRVPDTATDLGGSVFSNCDNLATVTLPASVTEIPAAFFRNCSKLKDFAIPATVTKIGENAFSNCVALTEITVPSAVANIGLNAFSGLDGVTRINYYAANASSESAPFAMSDAAYERSGGVSIYVGDASQPAVTNLPQNLFAGHKAVTDVLFRNVKLEAGVQDYGVNAFKDCTSLKTVRFGDACVIKVINDGAFAGCFDLHTVEFIENMQLQTIGARAFENCRALHKIAIGKDVTEIKDGAFAGCERLLEVRNLSVLNINKGEEKNGGVARYAKYVYGADGASRISTNPSGYVFYTDTSTGSQDDILLIGYTGEDTALTLPVAALGVNSPYNIYKAAFKGNTQITSISFSGGPTTSCAKKIDDSAFEGCTSLTTVDLPTGLEQVGNNLFQGCTSLTNVNFHNNNKLSTIPDNMFRNCSSLNTIEIPRRVQFINTYAFGGCTELRTVKFAGSEVKALRGHAFDGCTSLSAMVIPASVTLVEASCFEDCSNLRFAYLPDNAEYKADAFKGCSDELVLISKNNETYAVDKEKANLKSFVDAGKLTYLVPVKLIYDDGCEFHQINKLYNMDGDLSQDLTTLIWSSVGRMPIQNCPDSQLYVDSVWFEEKEYTTRVDVNELTAKLAVEGVSGITLYARYFAHPELTAPNSVDYVVGKEYSVRDILTEIIKENGVGITAERADELIRTFSFSVISHTLVNGDPDDEWSWEAGKSIIDAGVYTLSITLPTDGSYGGWASSKTVEFTINAGRVDITELLVWKALAPDVEYLNGNLKTESLYFYHGTQTPYLEQLEGQTPTETVNKSNSYSIYTGSEITIRLEWIDESHNYGAVESYAGNVATEAGTYVASATLIPFNNYIFTYGTGTAISEKLNTLNLSFDTKDGKIVVTKKWYIAISDANQLLSSDADGGLFDVSAEWNYGEKGSPSRPTLSKIPLQASEILTFTLSYTDGDGNTVSFNDGNKISISQYEKYFNASLPAGVYTAKFFIADGRDENDNIVKGDPEGREFTFTVRELNVTKTDVNQVKNMLPNVDVPYTDNAINLAGDDAVAFLNSVYKQATPSSAFVWHAYPQYYTPFAIKYRVVMLGVENTDENYYTKEEYAAAGSNLVKPQAIGSYTVYYIIEAPNYATSVSGSYKLNITYTLRPVLPAFDYDGNCVLNAVIRNLERVVGLEYFDIYTMLDYSKLSDSDSLKRETMSAPDTLRIKNMNTWGKNDAYSEIGSHLIFLRIKAGYSSYIKWGDATTDGYLYLKVDVIPSANSLLVNEWQFGRFNEAENKPVLKVSYGAATEYAFVLRAKNGTEKDTYLYYTDPKLAAGVTAGHEFKDAPVGEYLLTASATVNGEAKFVVTDYALTVHKVSIDFAKTPYLVGWTYGQLEKDTDIGSQIKDALALGAGIDPKIKNDLVLRYATAANYEAGRTPVASISSLAKDGYIPSGDYYVVLTRAADDDYEELSYAIKFSVLKAPNYWITAPSDKTFKSVTADELYAMFVAGYGTEANVKIELKAEGSDDWRGIKDYAPVGNVLDGNYQMRVTVVSDDFTELSETVSLVVDSKLPATTDGNKPVVGDEGISDGALIATLVVLGVVALAVIAAGTVLVILRNKKANADYVKTVKSEMKRR